MNVYYIVVQFFNTRTGKALRYFKSHQMKDYIKDNGILIAFWDGVSKGTKQMIDTCSKDNIKTYIIKY